MASTAGEVARRSVVMTSKNLECCINLVDKVTQGLRELTPILKSSMNKMLSNIIISYRAVIHERKSPSVWQTSLFYFKKLPQTPQPSATTNLISQQTSTMRQDPPPAKRL